MNEKSIGMPYARRYSVLAAIMPGSIMGPIDASIVNTVLPTITQFFNPSAQAFSNPQTTAQ